MKAATGEKFEHTYRFRQKDVIEFARITGDDNPVHLDATYAESTAFKKPIMHGFLSGSIFSKVFGTIFPGHGSIYLSQTMVFKRPMYVDQEYKAVFEIMETDAARGTMTIQGKVFDQANKICLEGEAKLLNKSVF